MSVIRIGAVTIGQAPRDDVVPELASRIGGSVEIVQRGALDGVAVNVINANLPSSPEATLVTRLTDGTEVTVDKGFIEPRLQRQIRSLEEEGISLILLLCTHKFEGLESKATLIRPSETLERIVERLDIRRLGVFTPSKAQVRAQRMRWRKYASEGIRVASASPYLECPRIDKAAAGMRDKGVDAAVLDCIGYNEAMRSRVQEILNVPVHSAVSALANAAAEVLEGQLG